MSYELTGKLIQKKDVHQVNDRFKKREFVVETESNVGAMVFTNYVKFQLTQTRCDLIDQFNLDDMLKISFDIKGNKWEKDGETVYFTNLEAWKIAVGSAGEEEFMPPQAVQQPAAGKEFSEVESPKAPPGQEPPGQLDEDELPF